MKSGVVVANRFEILAPAGRGGMGEVYRALDQKTGDQVALKVLTHAEGARRFEREARVLASLGHPGVVRYVTHGETEAGEPFLAMEWLSGETLAQYLRRATLTIEQSVDLVERVAQTLGVVHREGVVHRDLKPGNLFLVERDLSRIKVLDFGIARMDLAQPIVTLSGQFVGTPGYMSPEQARGETAIDARSDVFSLGCVLFRCLAGRSPFAGTSATVLLAKVVLEEPDRVRELRREISRPLDTCVARMLQKEPADRPPDGLAVAALLEGLDPVDLERRAPSVEPVPEAAAQQLVTVVLARRPPADELDTVQERPSQAPPVRLDLEETADRHGLSHVQVATGANIMTVTGANAVEQVARAARCAIEIRSTDAHIPLAVATGRASVQGDLPVGDAVERATILLEQAPTSGVRVRLDAVTAQLLGEGFALQRADDGGQLLVGESS